MPTPAAPDTIEALTRLDVYDHGRERDTLYAELTADQFRRLAAANGWQAETVRLLLELTAVPGRVPRVPRINMGRLRVTVIQ